MTGNDRLYPMFLFRTKLRKSFMVVNFPLDFRQTMYFYKARSHGSILELTRELIPKK